MVKKKILEFNKGLDRSKQYSLEDAISCIQERKKVQNFDATMDIAINLGVDPRHSEQMVRGVVSLPAGTGKNVRVVVICKDDKISEATSSGADIAGSVSVIDDIKAGNMPFDVCIATPDMMGMVGQVARILGPKGLMPNPKLGTVTTDVSAAVKKVKAGQVEYRVDKGGIVHAGVGKLSFLAKDLSENIKTFFASVSDSKPVGLKGVYLKSVYLSSTMSPSFKVDLSTIIQQK